MFLMALALAGAAPHPMAVQVVRDPITDAASAYATLRDGDGNRLVVSCSPSRFRGARVTLHARRWFAHGNLFNGNRRFRHRFDDARPRRMTWDVRDRSATLENRRRTRSFLGWLAGSNRLAIRATDVEDHGFDIVFELEGVRPALEQTMQACGQTFESS